MRSSNSIFKMFVYILECSDHSYYVSVTNDLERRLLEHSAGIDPDSYTANRRPIVLVYYAGFQSPKAAIQFEKKIKKWSRLKKQALIQDDFAALPNLAKKQFKSGDR